MTTKDCVFYFDFYNEDTDKSTYYGFVIKAAGCERFGIEPLNPRSEEIDPSEYISDAMLNAMESDYGVHDWSSSPNPKVDGIGFSSYEIEKSNYPIVMDKWRTYFVEKCGEDNVTEVKKLNRVGCGDDYVMYRRALK